MTKKKKEVILTSLEKKREVFVLSQVVFNGTQPRDILERRRPLESADNWTLDYRLDNYYAVQVSLFRRAINDYLQVLNKADIQIVTDSSDMKKWLEITKKFVNNRYYSIQNWLFNYISVERQKDPNAVLIPIVNFDFPKRFDNGFGNNKEGVPNGIPFFDDSNKTPDVNILYVNYDKVKECTETYMKFSVGEWVYAIADGKDKSMEYFLEADKEIFYLTIPELKSDKNDVVYTRYPYYTHALGQTPYVSIGGTSMTEYDCNNLPIEYNVSDYYGAIAFACYMIATMSDKQVIEARNNFPIKYKFQAKCTAHGCENGYCGFGDDRVKCGTCEGSGYQKDTNPFGDFVYEMSGSFLDDSSKQLAQPINYVVPPIDALKYISENFKEYNTYVANELCVTLEQNMTNQAAESKRYDLMNKVTLVTYIVDDVLRVSETILSFVELLLGSKPTLFIKKPQTWDVKNREDILFEISQAKTNGSPNFVVKNLVKELLLSDLKDNPSAQFIVDFLMKKDKLITFGTSDLKDARIIYGADISQREQVIHDNGLQILLDLFAKDTKPESIDSLFEEEVSKYITVVDLKPSV